MELPTKIIAIEGDDGSGKSTAAVFMVELLGQKGKSVLHVGPTNLPPYAKEIRGIVTGPNLSSTSIDVRALMFTSYLLNIYDELVYPNWGKYDYIVIDRTYLSTLVYQDDSILLSILADQLPELMKIDVLVYLDLSPGVGIERIKSRQGGLDDFESTFTLHEITKRRKLYTDYYNELPVSLKYMVDANREQSNVLLNINEITNGIVEHQAETYASEALDKL